MYRIIHLTVQGKSVYWRNATDYDPMDLEQALSLVTVLNRDAIQSSLLDRWVVEAE